MTVATFRFYAELNEFLPACRRQRSFAWTCTCGATVKHAMYGYENTPGWDMIWGPTPPWDAAALILPWELYRNYGATRILAQMYDTQKKLVDYTGTFINAANDYSYNRGLGEWSSAGPTGPTDATTVAYYYSMVDTLANIGAIVGKAADSLAYRVLAREIRDAYNARYWDEAGRYYRFGNEPYSQTQNALPLAFGMVPAGNEAAVASRLNADVVANGHHINAGVFTAKHLLTILTDYGHVDTAYAVATQTTPPSWGHWIENDLATLLEGWDLASRSYDHHYFGSISAWFFQSLAGIRPVGAGYTSVVTAPHVPNGLDAVKASVKTPRGDVAATWARRGREFVLRVRIPSNTPAEVWVPASAGSRVSAPEGAAFVRRTDQYAVYRVRPGSFTFQSTLRSESESRSGQE